MRETGAARADQRAQCYYLLSDDFPGNLELLVVRDLNLVPTGVLDLVVRLRERALNLLDVGLDLQL